LNWFDLWLAVVHSGAKVAQGRWAMAQGLDGADPQYTGSAKIELHQRNR